MPQISIIIPVYKVEKYLPACLDSVLAQTFTDFEAICIDDGSPDNCGKILADYAQKDKRIRVITQENQGVSEARNNGLKEAKGDYICFLDSDDALADTFLEKMYDKIVSTGSDIVSCNAQNAPFKKGEPSQTHVQLKTFGSVFDRFLAKKPKIVSSIWAKLYKKSALKDIWFPKGVQMGQDLVFLYPVLYQAKQASYFPENLYFYRVREGSTTHSNFSEKKIVGNIQIATHWHNYFKDKELCPETRRLLNKRIARQIFKATIWAPRKYDREHVDKWYALSRPLVLELKQKGIYQPRYLGIKNRLKSWLFLKG